MRAPLVVFFAILATLAGAPRDARAGSQTRGASDAPAVANPHGSIKTECEACHTAKSWKKLRKPLLFRHASTGFDLIGKHASAECVECHKSLEFARVATSCNDCHHDIHEGRAGNRCQDCHAPRGWTNRSEAVAQHVRTGFPLRGMHALVECARCHVGSGEDNRMPLSRACYPCHAPNFAAAQNPNHVAAGYSTLCEGCHDPGQARWGGAGFNHALTGFALTGAHATVACASCHVGGQYAGTPRDCYSCHQMDYTGTTNPNHVSAGYPTTCASCHSTSAWRPAKIDHDGLYFRIYSGAHQGKWASCADCHFNGATFADFNCLACHAHNQTDMDAKHLGRLCYSYVSSACYSCHLRA